MTQYIYQKPSTPGQEAWNKFWLNRPDRKKNGRIRRAETAYCKARETMTIEEAREVFVQVYDEG